MSKNLTRKGLALAAIAALGVSVFAGAPAHATESSKILLAPTAGTTYTSIVGASFSLNNQIDPTIKSAGLENKDLSKLKFLVTNSAAAYLTLDVIGAKTGAAVGDNVSAVTADTADTMGASYTSTASTISTKGKAIVVSGLSLDSADAANGGNHLTIKTTTDATDNVSVSVQAWIDDNGNNKIDTTELTSVVRSVNWVQASAVTATTTITSSTIGTSTLKASVVLGNDINMANLNAGDVGVKFTKNGSTLRTWADQSTNATYSVDVADTAYVTADNAREVTAYTNNTTGGSNGEAIGANTYVAQAYFQGNTIKLGAASNATAPVNGSVSADSTDTLEATASANVVETLPATTTNATTVRTGYAGNITFTSKVKYRSVDGSTDYSAVGAGVTVKVTLTNSALASTSSFVAGGKTLTSTSGAQSFTTTTAADGTISFTGAGTGAKGDAVVINLAVLQKTGGYTTAVTGQNTVTWADTALSTAGIVNTDLIGAAPVLKIVKGSTYNLNYVVSDQFGQAITTGSYRAKITTTDGTAAFTYYATSNAGKISQAIVDNATAAGAYTVTAALYKWNATNSTWDDQSKTASVSVVTNTDVATAVSATAASSSAIATITKTLVNADLRVDNVTNTQALIGYGASGTKHTISGTVTQASGAVLPGAVVTVTGAGLGFVVNNGANAVYSVGSATINTNASGYYTVDIYSTTAGKQTVVVTSGAATKSVVVEFSGVTTTINTNVISLDVVSLSQVGRAVTVTVKVVDKFGNPVKGIAAAVSVTGVGSLSASTATTAADGTATLQFLAGANDFGDAVITAKYTGVDAAGAEAVVSTSKTVTVGVTDAQIDIVGKRVTAVSSFTKGRTVSFYVDGVKKWSKLSASDADVVLYYNLKKGTHTVTVKISGGFVTTEKFIVQ